MEQINRIEILGTLGNVRVFTQPDSTPFARFSVVTKRVFYQQSSETDVVESTWHNVVANQGKACPNLAILANGKTCHVIGRVRNSKYTGADGQEHYSSDIVAQSVEILDEPVSVQV